MKRSAIIILTALFVFSGSLNAANKPIVSKKNIKSVQSKAPIIHPATRISMSDEELAVEKERLSKVARRTEHMFTLLSAEMALNKGDVATALGLYLNQLRQTRSPDVAERAMELAVNVQAYSVAELIYREWQEIEPTPSPALRRLQWVRSLALGEYEIVIDNASTVLQEANPEQRQRMFLLLAQISLLRPEIVQQGKTIWQKVTDEYPNLAEATIFDVFVSVVNNENERAVNALSRLSRLDKEISPATALALQILAQNYPQLLNQFFEQHDRSKLSVTWRELEIDSLLSMQHYDLAREKLQNLLGDAPNGRLYVLAARLAVQQKASAQTILAYLDKAYQSGTSEDKSAAAFLAAMYQAEAQNYDEAEKWVQRIETPEYAFDKLVLQASLAVEQKKWQKAYQLTQSVRKLPEQRGRFFNSDDIDNIHLYTMTKVLPPQKAVTELTRQLKQLELKNSLVNEQKIARILYQRALVYADELQQPEKAIKDLKRYVAINPDNANGLNALGYTMLSLNNPNLDEALELIRSAYQQKPDNDAINDSLGWVYYLRDEIEMALPFLEFSYRQSPSAETGAHLGAALWKNQQKDKAREIWETEFKRDKNNDILNNILTEFGVKFE